MSETEGVEPEVVHHDEHLLIVDKPPGLPTTAPTPSEPSLVNWVHALLPAHIRPHPTSRLDAPVSGLVTFALTKRANRHLLEARRAGGYERVYVGITAHDVPSSPGDWDWPISIDPTNPKRRIAGPGRGERAARTRCELAARTPIAALLRFMPATGRTHQIRAHAAEAGLPLFGDHLYGGERRLVLSDGSVVTARRVMLHCARVSYPSLSGNARMQFDAPARPDMERVWVALGGTPSELQL